MAACARVPLWVACCNALDAPCNAAHHALCSSSLSHGLAHYGPRLLQRRSSCWAQLPRSRLAGARLQGHQRKGRPAGWQATGGPTPWFCRAPRSICLAILETCFRLPRHPRAAHTVHSIPNYNGIERVIGATCAWCRQLEGQGRDWLLQPAHPRQQRLQPPQRLAVQLGRRRLRNPSVLGHKRAGHAAPGTRHAQLLPRCHGREQRAAEGVAAPCGERAGRCGWGRAACINLNHRSC